MTCKHVLGASKQVSSEISIIPEKLGPLRNLVQDVAIEERCRGIRSFESRGSKLWSRNLFSPLSQDSENLHFANENNKAG